MVHIEIIAFKTRGICLCAEHCIENLHSHIETNEASQALFSRYVTLALLLVLLSA